MDTPPTFGPRFKQLLKDRGHTQNQAAELLGRTPQYIWMVANDRARPGKDFMGDLARIYELDLVEWSGYAGHRPEHAAEDPAVEAAELALAAAGWQYDPSFGVVLTRVFGERTVEELAVTMRHKPSFLAAALRGWVPGEKGILLDWAHYLDLDVATADELFKAAGHRGWDPVLGFVEGACALALSMGLPAPFFQSPYPHYATLATPREVARWREVIKERLYSALKDMPPGAPRLHWVIRLPDAPEDDIGVTFRWETASRQLADSVAGAQRALDTILAWAPVVGAVAELARLCEERNGSISFDFRKLAGLENSAAAAEIVASARRQAEGEPK